MDQNGIVDELINSSSTFPFFPIIDWSALMIIKKRVYRTISINAVNLKKLHQACLEQNLCVGIDVAKEVPFACIMTQSGEILLLLKFQHPTETRRFVQMLADLPASQLVCALESTGTYGDALRYLLLQAGIPVYLVSAHKAEKMAEVYDGVPSQHDAKCAAIIAKLHHDGISTLWCIDDQECRELKALFAQYDWYNKQLSRNINKLEALLARHWPELPQQLKLDSPTLLELLISFGNPEAVTRQSHKAKKLMRRVGKNFLLQEKIDAILESASTTVGLPVLETESNWIRMLASDTRRLQKEQKLVLKQLKQTAQHIEPITQMAPAVGDVTATIIYLKMGPASLYDSPKSYLKAMGLNLAIIQSGTSKLGQLHISKRGDSTVRKYLYFATMRWIQNDCWANAWYLKKVQRDGGKLKMKALIALMRKLVQGLWHVGQGNTFDSSKLFDLSKLSSKLVETQAQASC